MYLSSLTNRGATPALIQTLTYSETRLQMIAENVANMQTPGYRAKQLDVRGFQKALREALDEKGSNPHKTLEVKVTDEVRTVASGSLQVRPSTLPSEHMLLHDGTNLSLERQMSQLAETGMIYEFATVALNGNFDGLRKAIRGRL